MRANPARRVILNGDDFGLSAENNAGIIAAHRHGVLSSTSLMIGGDAVEEALDLARQNPTLAVGLHVTFSDTKPVLPPEQVPLLVESNGYFPPDDVAHRAALLTIKGRRQICAEIAAQCRAFHATGLACDHINSHRHSHKNLLIAMILFREAARWNMPATRIPWDPPTDALRYSRGVMLWQLAAMRKLHLPDRSIGRNWSVTMLTDLLRSMPAGMTELYFHPVTAKNHMFADDLPILLDPDVKSALAGLTLSGYAGASL
jgi:chitin disaccharide deacetylase